MSAGTTGTLGEVVAAPGRAEIVGNTVTQVIRRLRDRVAGDDDFPTVVARLRRTRAAA